MFFSMQPSRNSNRLRCIFNLFSISIFTVMNRITKIFALTAFAITTIFQFATAASPIGSDPKTRVEMRFLRGDEVEAGKVITAELTSNSATEVDLVIENEKGDSFGEKHVIIDNGAKLIRFKVMEVPTGTYYIKVVHRLQERRYAFSVK